ncbi:MAG: hypothetical protein WDA68_03330 [Phycisphaerae bacterium]
MKQAGTIISGNGFGKTEIRDCMQTSEFTQIFESGRPNRPPRKRLFRLRNLIWLFLMALILAAGILFLALHKPADYVPTEPIIDNQVSKYLTHVIVRDLYNGAQLQEPFELIVTQEGINDIIARLQWPMQVDGISILVPQVIFEPELINVRAMIQSGGVDLLVSVSGNAFVNNGGMLNIDINNVKMGALNITVLAKAIAKSIYEKELSRRSGRPVRAEDVIVKAILENQPFDPTFRIEGNYLTIESVDILQGKMILKMNGANYRMYPVIVKEHTNAY